MGKPTEGTLTIKERKIALAYATGAGSKRECARRAGYAQPAVDGTRAFQRPRVQSAIAQLLARQGITEDALADKMKELLNADSPLYNSRTGKLIATPPDNRTRARVLELAFKCLGWLNDNQVNVNMVNVEPSEVLSEARENLARYQQALESINSAEGGGEGGQPSSGISSEAPSVDAQPQDSKKDANPKP